MATPTGATKRLFACGSNEAATWGTATAVGANDEILALDDGGFALVQSFDPYPAIDQIMAQSGDLGLIGPCDFSPTVWLQYEPGAWGSWLAALFGTEATANSNNAITHTFTWADSVTDFFTVVQERPGKIWECASAMPMKLVIKPDGSHISAVATLRGNTIIDDSAVNAATQVDALTPVSRANFVNFTHGVFRLNAVAAALDANNAVTVSDFEVSLERAIDGQHVLGSTVIASPVEGAMPTAQLKVTLPRATSTDVGYMTQFKAGTAFKADLTFTGGVIAGSNDANNTTKFILNFPRLVLKQAPDAKLEDVIKNELTFEVQESSTAANGMSSNRAYCVLRNGQVANYLA